MGGLVARARRIVMNFVPIHPTNPVAEENNWQGSVRFLDQRERPVTDLKIETKP